MSILSPGMAQVPDSTENWDDDFEFNHNEHNENKHANTRRSTTSTHFNEDWDDAQHAAAPLTKDKKNTLKKADTSLEHWAEAGPSTPVKRAHVQTENWDDDFQDKAESPLRDTSPRSRRTRQRPLKLETENWDDEFEAAHASKVAARWEESSSSDEEFGFGDREDDRTVTSRSRRATYTGPLSNHTPPPPVPPLPLNLLGTRQDPAPFPRSPSASVFSMPVSSAGRDSVAGQSYSSTAHLALRPTLSGSSLGHLPPSQPAQRERRRLRKKSRPPRVDEGAYELEEVSMPLSLISNRQPPSTPERGSPQPQASSSISDFPVEDPPATTTKSSLVSRIGSVGKKWNATRKKRASTGPSEVTVREDVTQTPRPPSMAAAASSSPSTTTSRSGGWFFRHGGGLGPGSGSPPGNATALPLRHEKSVDRLLSMVGMDPDSPSRRKQKTRQGLPADLRELMDEADGDGAEGSSARPPASEELSMSTPRRPISMQVPQSAQAGARRRTPRHVSYGQPPGGTSSSSRSSSKARSASESVEDLGRKPHRNVAIEEEKTRAMLRKRDGDEKEPGSRSFMGGMRRISLGGKHKRAKSSVVAGDDGERERQSTSTSSTAVPVFPPDRSDDTTPRPPSRVMRPSMEASLLPPIELQPPSPPRVPVGMSPSRSVPASGLAGIDALFSPSLSMSTSASSLDPTHDITSPTSSSSISFNVSSSPPRTRLPASPQQSASLGRSALPPKDKEINGAPPRRSSLGDLKIPARISQAQVGLRRDLGMVREFATSVEQLKQLQASYNSLVSEVQAMIISTAPPDPTPSRVTSPSVFNLPRRGSRGRSNTNPQAPLPSAALLQAQKHQHLKAMSQMIGSKYRISWECAELLIELGGGAPAIADEPEQPSSPPTSTRSVSTVPAQSEEKVFPEKKRKNERERAITLAGNEPKPQIAVPSPLGSPPLASPPNPVQWRASTGRNDLSQRQLHLLREMLNNPDSTMAMDDLIPEEDVNRSWRWGDAMNSTVTLPSEESSQPSACGAGKSTPIKKRRSSRLGMRGLRDMLKSLKKSVSEQPHAQPPLASRSPAHTPPPIPLSSISISTGTQSSLNLPREQPRPQSVIQRRRAKTSVGPDTSQSLRGQHPNSPYVTASASMKLKSSPRRPSLASIFRLGQRNKSSGTNANSSPQSSSGRELSVEDVPHANSSSSGHVSASTFEEEDWDRVESISDLQSPTRMLSMGADGTATVRGKKGQSPYLLHQQRERARPETPRRTPNPSQSSLWGSAESPQQSVHSQPNSPPMPGQPASYSRSTKLSNVYELAEREGEPQLRVQERTARRKSRASGTAPSASPGRPGSRGGRGNAPSAPALPPPAPMDIDAKLALAMTPENIKPLLENAREVHFRCTECIAELRALLAAHQPAD